MYPLRQAALLAEQEESLTWSTSFFSASQTLSLLHGGVPAELFAALDKSILKIQSEL
jgi:hypothetical protein